MRISIRRCLSMLRNTGDGNELALPLPMPIKVHSVVVGILLSAGFWCCDSSPVGECSSSSHDKDVEQVTGRH